MPLFGLFVGFCWGVPVVGFVASGRYFGACAVSLGRWWGTGFFLFLSYIVCY